MAGTDSGFRGFASPQALAQEATRRAASGDVAGAEPLFGRLVELAPREPNAWAGLGRCRLALGQVEAAEDPLRRAAALAPNNATAAINLAGCLGRLGRHEDALAELGRAAALQPENAVVAYNRGRALEALGRRGEAREAYDDALVRDSRLLPALSARAALLAGEGERLAAIGDLDLALAQRPADARLRLRRAVLALATGDWLGGLADHELRLDLMADGMARRPDLPLWRGESVDGRHVLLFAEAEDDATAIGDTLQMLRFVPALRSRAAAVTVEAPEALTLWLGQCIDLPPGVQLCARGNRADADLAVAMLSLPHLCDCDAATLPPPLPLRVAPSRPRRGGVIGIAPSADGPNGSRLQRSLPADALARLSGAAKVVALQPSDRHEPADIGGIAEEIGTLDLVVTADNWIAHLAGTMGVPAALLLDTAADWRWLELRTDTAWYPSMRLYRQDRPGDWAGAIAMLAGDLPRLLRAG